MIEDCMTNAELRQAIDQTATRLILLITQDLIDPNSRLPDRLAKHLDELLEIEKIRAQSVHRFHDDGQDNAKTEREPDRSVPPPAVQFNKSPNS